VAKLLKEIVEKEAPDVVLLGKQSIDGDCAQTGPMLAAMLGWPQATMASELTFADGGVTAERETDNGTEVIQVGTPLVVTADLRLNEPRYAKLPNIMKAKKKKIEAIDAASLGVDLSPRIEVVEMNDPPTRAAGIVVEDVTALVDKLKNEASVIA